METSLVINQGAEAMNLAGMKEVKELAAGYGLTESGLALFSAWAAHQKTGDREAKAIMDGLSTCSGGIFLD